MSDIFISYKVEDRARVARLVRALEKHGLSIWWDQGLPGGEEWRVNIQRALDSARCVIVVWTRASVGPAGGFVRDEASRASIRGVLVPVRLDRVAAPLGFGELQVIDLAQWAGSARDPFLLDLVSAARAKLDGRPVPPAKGPTRRAMRRVAASTAATGLLLAAGGLVTNAFGVQDRLCASPIAQPIVSDMCGTLKWGGRPTRRERLDWEGRPRGSCDALRKHIRQYPDGAFRTVAEAMLEAVKEWDEVEWAAMEQPLSIYVGRDAPASKDEQVAKATALERGQLIAERKCRDFVAGGLHRFKSAVADAQEWICTQVKGGVVCAFDGRALCKLEEARRMRRESCE